MASNACTRGALTLSDFHMLKLLLTAVGLTQVPAFLLSTLGIINFSVKTTYVVGIVIGGLIFGGVGGMAVAGFCLGTMLAVLPGGDRRFWWAVASSFGGFFAYALLYEPLKPLLVAPLNLGKLTLPGLLGLDPVLTGVSTSILLLAGVILLDRLTRPKLAQIPGLSRMVRE